ncbi:YrdB family protein [Peterkaempfera griseoplana]|uniref:YrdB family protein n=1 Tax=Peterkaempfera griseoplana TaxID=66896 RepID=UPI0006E2AEB7|nr:YrdB family protein [Peterkaempfera griseoplana]
MSAVSGVLAFLAEIGVYVAAGWWGFTRRAPLAVRLLLAMTLVALFAALWGMFGAPSAAHPLHGAARAALELCWFGAGAGAWAAVKGWRAALSFTGVWLLSAVPELVCA